ncbi:MAG TPA: hypothetical protein VJ124_03235 [Pyrinomonadaceae bacterium]|nr:hypothetical protein [Pyrinomonadaceae bacterium]
MRARKGGLAAQARYRAEGRDPLEMANITKSRKRRAKLRQQDEEQELVIGVPEQTSMSAIALSGTVKPGLDAQRTAEEIQRQIMAAIEHMLNRDTRFGQHLAFPKESWIWEVRLVPFRRTSYSVALNRRTHSPQRLPTLTRTTQYHFIKPREVSGLKRWRAVA